MKNSEQLAKWIAVYNALWGDEFAPDDASWKLRLRQAKRMIAKLTEVEIYK